MKLSIVISILDSHRVVKRYIRHLKRLNLPRSVETIFIDDGSIPPLQAPDGYLRNFSLYHTNNYDPWTQGIARNWGATLAKGEYLFMTDIDHIISKEAVDAILSFSGDKMIFPRQYGVLDNSGRVCQDIPTLQRWGLHPVRYRRRGLWGGMHGNTWAMKRKVFLALGGYSRRRITMKKHTMHEDAELNRRYVRAAIAGKVLPQVIGPPIYFYPVGRFHATGDENPFGFFHGLVRDSWEDQNKGRL